MSNSSNQGQSGKDKAQQRTSRSAPGTGAPEPKDTSNATPTKGAQSNADEVQAQREAEEKAALEVAQAGAGGSASPSEKAAQTRAAADQRERARFDAEAQAQADADAAATAVAEGEKSLAQSEESPAQRQRREEAEAVQAKADEADEALSDEDRVLLAAAPGGARTALTKGKEGSTAVTHTAAQARPPLSGPLHHPANDIENLAATEEDPDNRVYAGEAGPREVFKDTTPVKARYVDGGGNALAADAIFEEAGSNKTFVLAKTRVYEVFNFPNTEVEGKRLAYTKGKRVPRGEAENVKNQISVNSPIL